MIEFSLFENKLNVNYLITSVSCCKFVNFKRDSAMGIVPISLI